jgi:hypothetical protein
VVATVSVDGATYTIELNHNTSSNTVSVTVTGNDISYFSGNISLDGGGTYSNPGTLTRTKPNTGGGSGNNYPPSATLAEYGLSGLTPITGATGVSFITMKQLGVESLVVYFKGSTTTDNYVINWFTSNGWEEFMSSTDNSGVMYYYLKTGFTAIYTRDLDNNDCMIMAYGGGTGGGGTGPGTEASPIPLTAGTWVDGSVPSGSSVMWYSFNVTSGTTYYVWWNDKYEGNSTKTGDVVVSASYSSGTDIFTVEDSGWDYPKSFTASTSGTVKIKVMPLFGQNTGTFAIAYSTNSTRPGSSGGGGGTGPGTEANPIPLTADVWKDGSVPSASSVVWYSFSVTGGTT